MSEELKPCPFCGGDNVRLINTIVNGENAVKTTHTGCEAEVLFYGRSNGSRKAVADTWNTRQPEQARKEQG